MNRLKISLRVRGEQQPREPAMGVIYGVSSVEGLLKQVSDLLGVSSTTTVMAFFEYKPLNTASQEEAAAGHGAGRM
jgi:hypothetical protein